MHEGEQKEIEKGREEGRVALILRLLSRLLGEIAFETQEQIRTLEVTDLDVLGDALLDFSEMSDLDAWLKDNGW